MGILAHGFARAHCDECTHDGGFSVDESVRIEGADRMGLERLLRYCARPPFALEHLHQRDAEHLVYRNPEQVRGTARGPPLWEAAADQWGNDPQWDVSAQPAPDIEFPPAHRLQVRAGDRMNRRS